MKALLKAGFPLVRPFVVAALLGAALLGVVRGQSGNLIGWWKLDDAFGADSSGVANHGLMGSGVTAGVPGPNGATAFHFDGGPDSHVTIPATIAPPITTITASAWFNADDFGCGQCGIVSNEGLSGSNRWGYGIRIIDGGNRLQVCWGTQDGPAGCAYAPYAFSTGTWTHVAGSYDGSVIRGYVNGQPVVEQPDVLQALDTDQNLTIGRLPSGALAWRGSIADVRLFDRTLTDSEVFDIFTGSAPQDLDADDDGFDDDVDNCSAIANADQLNTDGDAEGDACDPDDDNDTFLDAVDQCALVAGTASGCPDGDSDGVRDTADNCPAVANANQLNTDGDAQGNACDPDDDNDTRLDTADNCPAVANANQFNADGDAEGDACDPDDDNDLAPDGFDNCPTRSNPFQDNRDGDALGDACDPDDDNDGFSDPDDFCQFIAGTANGCPEVDADGVPDRFDNCPTVSNADQLNSDSDSFGNACDDDDDNDRVSDLLDNCSVVANIDQANNDFDSFGNACDPDDDNDGRLDGADNCPMTPNADQWDSNQNGQGDACDASTAPSAVRPGFDRVAVSGHDDISVPAQLAMPLLIGGVQWRQAWVNSNGVVSFGTPLNDKIPTLPSARQAILFAPYWADAVTNCDPSITGYMTYGNGAVDGRPAFAATWRNVTDRSCDISRTNTFQVVFIDRSDLTPGQVDVEFNYGQIQWDWSGPPGYEAFSHLYCATWGYHVPGYARVDSFVQACNVWLDSTWGALRGAGGRKRFTLPPAYNLETVSMLPPQPGGVVTTDAAGTGATQGDPVETRVRVPAGAPGPVTITETWGPPTAPVGYSMFNSVVQISAPPGTPANPLELTFELFVGTLTSVSTNPTAVLVRRNGVEVARCVNPTSRPIAPDPCVMGTSLVKPGVVRVYVLTSAASEWDFLVPSEFPAPPPAPTTILSNLITAVSELQGVKPGTLKALDAHLKAIVRSVSNDREVATKMLLRVFIAAVGVFDRIGHVPHAAAEELIDLAEALLDLL